jgi:ssDNA-binding Zn-finger/Zn-ribbon topoisomerase 1
MVASGCQCPKCKTAQMFVRTSKPSGDSQTRYLRCPKCDHSDKQVVHVAMIHRRDR